jgi:hypothetical protein
MTEQATAPAATEVDRRQDFDFLVGEWKIANRRLDDPLGENPTEWQEFEATLENRPILGGLGNIDFYTAPEFPGRGHFEGFGLRLFDASANVWRIWWASVVGEGQLDTPVVGGFTDGVGRFECDDTLAGRDVRVRYEWKDVTPTSARWEQSFSFDGGETFETNWINEFTRIG